MNFKKLISWNFSVVEQGEPLLIEANFTGGQLDFHQLCNGPIWGNDTEAILADIFANSKDILRCFINLPSLNLLEVNHPFSAAYIINGIIQVLNKKLKAKGYNTVKIGIGIAKGDAFMVQAGYKGSGLDDVIWMGNVVNYACHLCGSANKNGNSIINISEEVYDDLEGKIGYNSVPYQSMMQRPDGENYYTGNVIQRSIEEWLENN